MSANSSMQDTNWAKELERKAIRELIRESQAFMRERCARVADGMAYVETCADDTARGTANAAPYRKVADAIRALEIK